MKREESIDFDYAIQWWGGFLILEDSWWSFLKRSCVVTRVLVGVAGILACDASQPVGYRSAGQNHPLGKTYPPTSSAVKYIRVAAILFLSIFIKFLLFLLVHLRKGDVSVKLIHTSNNVQDHFLTFSLNFYIDIEFFTHIFVL